MRRFLIAAFLTLPLVASADPQTERLWKGKCAGCHGADGKGQTEQGKKMATEDMTTAAWQAKFPDAEIKTAIADGLKREKNGAKQEMEAYKKKLRPDQIDALVAHIRTLKK